MDLLSKHMFQFCTFLRSKIFLSRFRPIQSFPSSSFPTPTQFPLPSPFLEERNGSYTSFPLPQKERGDLWISPAAKSNRERKSEVKFVVQKLRELRSSTSEKLLRLKQVFFLFSRAPSSFSILTWGKQRQGEFHTPPPFLLKSFLPQSILDCAGAKSYSDIPKKRNLENNHGCRG